MKIKILNIISAVTLFNLAAVVIIANIPFRIDDDADEIETEFIMPTPQVIVRQVIRKITKPATSNTSSTQQNTTNNNQTNNNVVVTAPPVAQTGCIVTLDGASYNVTNLQRTHSGGDIFACGTDMSATFWSRHGQSIFNKMQQYRI